MCLPCTSVFNTLFDLIAPLSMLSCLRCCLRCCLRYSLCCCWRRLSSLCLVVTPLFLANNTSRRTQIGQAAWQTNRQTASTSGSKCCMSLERKSREIEEINRETERYRGERERRSASRGLCIPFGESINVVQCLPPNQVQDIKQHSNSSARISTQCHKNTFAPRKKCQGRSLPFRLPPLQLPLWLLAP